MNNQEIQNLIKDLVERVVPEGGLLGVTQDDNSKTTWFRVEVKEPYLFLNREGEALSALNHVVRKIIESKTVSKNPDEIMKEQSERMEAGAPRADFLIDINGFQQKRIDNIHAIVHMMAERARYFKSNIEIDPMSAFDRRIVHEFLSDATDLKTESQGVGPTRRVVIKYVGNL